MNSTFLQQVVLFDSSAAVALGDPSDQFHNDAHLFFSSTTDVIWASLNATAHETFTVARRRLGFSSAIRLYDFMTGCRMYRIIYGREDELQAREHLVRLRDHGLSFHDALAAAVMKRLGIYRMFSFDHHFFLFGFEVLPGRTM